MNTQRMIVVMIFLALGAAATLTGCYVYQPAPVTVPGPSSFDRSWDAAVGAMQDVGVRIQSQDRSRGVITGANDSRDVTITLATQADGSVRVEFTTSGATAQDPSLIERVTRSYNARMGR